MLRGRHIFYFEGGIDITKLLWPHAIFMTEQLGAHFSHNLLLQMCRTVTYLITSFIPVRFIKSRDHI